MSYVSVWVEQCGRNVPRLCKVFYHPEPNREFVWDVGPGSWAIAIFTSFDGELRDLSPISGPV